MNLDPESCPHCGIAWANVTIVSPARRGQTYYLCEACGTWTPFGIWNYGYKPEFFAEVFLSGFERRGNDNER